MSLSIALRRMCMAAVALGCLGTVPSVWAQSQWTQCEVAMSGSVGNPWVYISFGKITVKPELAVGQPIKELTVPYNGGTYVVYCPLESLASRSKLYDDYLGRPGTAWELPDSASTKVYGTNVKGVGIRISRVSNGVTITLPDSSPNIISKTAKGWEMKYHPGYYKVELIKIGQEIGTGPLIITGGFTVVSTRQARITTDSIYYGVQGLWAVDEGSNVIAPTCKVQVGHEAIKVDFGTVPRTAFTGVGTGALPRDFDIQLICQGGSAAQDIGIELQDSQQPGNRTNVLSLPTGPGKATGIGIEIVRRDGMPETAVNFGQPIKVGSSLAGSSTLTLPLRARYIQTVDGEVGLGDASGQATFTIEYL